MAGFADALATGGLERCENLRELLRTSSADDLERACPVCLGVGNPIVNGVVVPCAHCNASGLKQESADVERCENLRELLRTSGVLPSIHVSVC